MMPSQSEKFAAFQRLHDGPETFVMPNPWDAGTSRLLTALGFPALATTSAGYAFAVGRPDSAGAISQAEILANAQAIVAATPLPVSADLENGFGDAPADCAETIVAAAAVGLVGGSIEDATSRAEEPIYPFEQAVARVAAACEAARNLPILVTARAENFLHGRPDLDDTIARLKAFVEVGAPVVYAPGLPDLAAIEKVCRAVERPVNVVMGLMGPSYSVAELAAVGVRRISVGGSFARAALGGLVRAAKEVQEQGTFTYDALPGKEAARLTWPSKESDPRPGYT